MQSDKIHDALDSYKRDMLGRLRKGMRLISPLRGVLAVPLPSDEDDWSSDDKAAYRQALALRGPCCDLFDSQFSWRADRAAYLMDLTARLKRDRRDTFLDPSTGEQSPGGQYDESEYLRLVEIRDLIVGDLRRDRVFVMFRSVNQVGQWDHVTARFEPLGAEGIYALLLTSGRGGLVFMSRSAKRTMRIDSRLRKILGSRADRLRQVVPWSAQ